MPQIKFAIFDVGNTIYPYTLQPLSDLLLQYTTDKTAYLNNHTAFDYDYKPYMRGILSHQDFINDLCRFCNVTYNKDMDSLIIKALFQGIGKTFTETLKAMHLLKSHGIEIGILSNALPVLGNVKTDLAPEKYIFTSYELGLLKPDIKIYQTLAQSLNVSYNQILFIDDKERNITPAKNLGINGIIFNKETILKEISPYLL